MSDRHAGGDPQGAALICARGGRLGDGSDTAFPGVAGDGGLERRATARSMRRSSTAISDAKLHRSERWRRNLAGAAGAGVSGDAADAAGAPALFQIWTLETGGPHHPGRLWVGAIPAGLFRSDDGGASWQLMPRALGCPGAATLVRRRL